MRCKKLSRPAFTLIELLVVVAIIALLIGILVPALSKAKDRANTIKCATNLKAWGTGMNLYSTQYDNRLPSKGNTGDSTAPVGYWNDPGLWFNAIPMQLNSAGLGYNDYQIADAPIAANGLPVPVGGMDSLFVCPSATSALGNTSAVPADTMAPDPNTGPYFQQYGWDATAAGALAAAPGPKVSDDVMTPADENLLPGQPRQTFFCYVMNSKFGSKADMNGAANDANWWHVSALDTNGVPAAELILMSEKRMRLDELQPSDPLNPYSGPSMETAANNNYPKAIVQSKGDWGRYTARHNNAGNVTFLDGHVELLKYTDVNTSTNTATMSFPGGKVSGGDWNHYGAWVWDPYGVAQ